MARYESRNTTIKINIMESKIFDKIIENRLQKCKDILVIKAKEYVKDEDRLHNFRVAEFTSGKDVKSKELALWGMANKHFVSIMDIIDECNNDPKYAPSSSLIEEKLTDMINYFLLLECCLQDRRNQNIPF